MNRRTFAMLALAGAFFSEVLKVSASSELAPPESAPAEGERFPISREDYKKVQPQYLPQVVDYPSAEVPGTIVIDTDHRFLYLVLGPGRAKRYGVGVGREGFGWSGTATIRRKAKWPSWFPPKAMMARDPEAARWPNGMPGGPKNPLGARAMYLYQGEVDTLFRIHGTREPKTIGRAVSSGCIRMLNADVTELFERVPIGTKVIVLRSSRPVAQAKKLLRSNPPVTLAKKGQQKAVRTAFERRRELRRRKRSIFDYWLRSRRDERAAGDMVWATRTRQR